MPPCWNSSNYDYRRSCGYCRSDCKRFRDFNTWNVGDDWGGTESDQPAGINARHLSIHRICACFPGAQGAHCTGVSGARRGSGHDWGWDADPVEEVYAARDILKAAGVRKEGPELVSCPTCGRTRIDLIGLATQVEERLKAVDKPITVAVMGCVVNGPGEASAADVGIAGGNGEGLLFRKGEIVKKVPQEALVDELFALIEEL